MIKAIVGWNQRRQYRQTQRWMKNRCSEKLQMEIKLLAGVLSR